MHPPRQIHDDIPGTPLFDSRLARKGYALNKMCYSFNDAASREAFLRDEVKSRQVLKMLQAGGNAYYLAKLAGIFGLDMQDIGAQQTGVSKAEFQARLVAARDLAGD